MLPAVDETHLRRATSFGSVADDYARARPGYPQAAVRWALERAPGTNVLDLAAGTGKLTGALLDAGLRVTAVEPLDGMRAQLEAAFPDVRALTGSAEAIPLEDASVDLVWCSEVLEHVPDTAGLLSEARRVLRTGGRLLVTTPSHDLPRRALIALARFEHHCDPLGQHVRFYSRRTLARVLDEFAFEEIHLCSIGGPPGLRETLVARARKARLA